MRRRVAAIIVAVSVVVVSVVFGLSVSATDASASTRAAGSATTDVSLGKAKHLLLLIPRAGREACFRRDPGSLTNGSVNVLAAVQCAAPGDGVDSVLYVQYDNAGTLASAYAASHPAGLPVVAAGGTTCNGTGDWSFGTARAGSYACFTSATTPTVVWYGTASEVLGIATGPDATQLMSWWRTAGGPRKAADPVTNFVSASRAAHRTTTKSLLANRGSALTRCKSRLNQTAPGAAEWAFSPWISAAEACSAPQHGSVYLAQLAPGAAKAYALYYVNQTLIGNKTASTPTGCTKVDLLDSSKKVVGALNCVQVGTMLYADWYTTDDGVFGTAQVATTPDKLFAYVSRHKLI
jgi:hypothetical protein